jgi:hypothetical protein
MRKNNENSCGLLLKQKIEIIYVDMKIDRAIEAPNF